MTADLDTLLTALYVLADDLLPRRPRARRRPQITDAELVCLAVAQILLDVPERAALPALRDGAGSDTCSPTCPSSRATTSGCGRWRRRSCRLLNAIAFASPSWCDNLRLLDSTPVPCGASRETVKRSEFAGYAAYGYCASHSRYFWGFRLYLLCASRRDADRVRAGAGQRPRARGRRRDARPRRARRLHRDRRQGLRRRGVRSADGANSARSSCAPTARTNSPASAASAASGNGSSRSSTRSRASSRSNSHGASTMPGLITRIAQRLLALAAGLWHNWNTGHPGRHLTAYLAAAGSSIGALKPPKRVRHEVRRGDHPDAQRQLGLRVDLGLEPRGHGRVVERDRCRRRAPSRVPVPSIDASRTRRQSAAGTWVGSCARLLPRRLSGSAGPSGGVPITTASPAPAIR